MSVWLLSKPDLARYPFAEEAARYVESLELTLADFAKPEYLPILERAEQRILEALRAGVVNYVEEPGREDVETLSFPAAVALVKALDDDFLRRRYALGESKRLDSLLGKEHDAEKIAYLAASFLGWKVEALKPTPGSIYEYAVHFVDYLKVAPSFQDEKWKLVNRPVQAGRVYLGRDDMARLIAEGVRMKVERRLEGALNAPLPASFQPRLERIAALLATRRAQFQAEELPKTVVTAAFPPCIRQLYDGLLAGRHLSHVGRFTLTSFLLTVGMKPDEVTRLFTQSPDADERMTRYQVEHIAGRRGSGTRYTPPKCGTLKTHGLCVDNGLHCGNVRHALTYYRRAARMRVPPTPTQPAATAR
ncbi:MAG: DNA primase large subunit PriL [Candidatus Bathyarchaeia archaeon]